MQVTIILKTNLETILENSSENKTSLRVTKPNYLFITQFIPTITKALCTAKNQGISSEHLVTVQHTTNCCLFSVTEK